MRYSLLILLVFATFIKGQVEYSQSSISTTTTPVFYFDLANYKGSTEGKTKVDVFIQVPYSNILFVKSGDEYKAKYSIDLRFMNENKDKVLDEKIWTEEIKVNDFQQTTSKTAFNISHRSFDILPGKYNVICYIEDLDSKKTASIEYNPVVRQIRDSLDISDIMLVSDVVQGSSGTSIIPNITNQVSSKTKDLPFYFEVYSDVDREVFLEFVVNEIQSGRSFNNMLSKHLQPGKNFIFEQMSNLNFLLGSYELSVKIKSESWSDLVVITKKFRSKFAELPGSIVDLDKAVDQMIYITTTSQLDSIQSATTFEDKLNRFMKFWERKDPSPATQKNEAMNEYYRRIQYANTHFKSYFEGWKSDMGWIYIILGPPDYVARHPMDLDSKPYEVWEYYDIRRSFTFVDETGFGHYRLVNPQYGEWFKYRY